MKFQKISLKQQKALEFQGLSYSVRKKIRTPDLLIRITLSSLFLSQLIKPLTNNGFPIFHLVLSNIPALCRIELTNCSASTLFPLS